MRSKGFEGMNCSIAEVLEALGDRWGVLIMRDLLLGLTRYDDLRQSSGVTNATLSDRLKHLEQAGLLERRLYQTRPDRHDYVPTAKGRDMALLMQALVQIGDQWRHADGRKPPLRFVEASSRHPLTLALTAAETQVASPPIAIEAGPGADDAMQWRVEHGRAERIKRAATADQHPLPGAGHR
jgi:DNA-binding HxlR family transcriptional regulator